MSRTGLVFVGALWAVGIATGIALGRWPDALPLPTPALTVPLLVAFAADLALRPAAAAGRVAPLSMNERAAGVIGAGLLAIAVSALELR